MRKSRVLSICVLALLLILAGCSEPTESSGVDEIDESEGNVSDDAQNKDKVDKTPPELVDVSTIQNGEDLPTELRFSMSDEGSGVSNDSLRITEKSTGNSVDYTKKNGTVRVLATGNAGTVKTYTVSVRDSTGNLASTTVKVNIENSYEGSGPSEPGDSSKPVSEIVADAGPDIDTRPDTEFIIDASGSSSLNGAIERYELDFNGDGETDKYWGVPEIPHAFESEGVYDIELRVVDASGETDSDDLKVSVSKSYNSEPEATPTADAGASIDTKVGDEVTLDASGSSFPGIEITEYEWDFDGDGSYEESSTSATISRTFDEIGDSVVILKVTGSNGKTDTDGVLVKVSQNSPPEVFINGNPSVARINEAVTFDSSNSNDPDGDISSYKWDFENDGIIDRETVDGITTHSYDAPGTYVTKVTVVDDDNSSKSKEIETKVNAAPTASLSDVNAIVGTEITLNGANSNDFDGSIVEYRWDFNGNGTTDKTTSIETTTYRYSVGEFNPQLTVVDNNGETSSDTATVSITNNAPVVDINRTSTFVTSTGVNFSIDSTATDPDGHNISSYEWTLSDELSAESNEERMLNATFENASNAIFELLATDEYGATGEDTFNASADDDLIYNVSVANSDVLAYTVEQTQKPDIIVERGSTITIEADAVGHPLHFSTKPNSIDFSNIYTKNVTVTDPAEFNPNATETGVLELTVSDETPNTLYYACSKHQNMGGKIIITE